MCHVLYGEWSMRINQILKRDWWNLWNSWDQRTTYMDSFHAQMTKSVKLTWSEDFAIREAIRISFNDPECFPYFVSSSLSESCSDQLRFLILSSWKPVMLRPGILCHGSCPDCPGNFMPITSGPEKFPDFITRALMFSQPHPFILCIWVLPRLNPFNPEGIKSGNTLKYRTFWVAFIFINGITPTHWV